jgi:phage tail-like protein
MLDVNGTRYQLLLGREDWQTGYTEAGPRRWEYDAERQAVRLQVEVFTFRQQGQAAVPLTPADRRGAAWDSYGHWYWIAEDETQILVRWAAASQPELLFPKPPEACLPSRQVTFQPAAAVEPAEPEPLAGLAVTGDGYLVAGSPSTGSLLVFDLYALDGGFVRVSLPPPPAAPTDLTEPFDLAALPDGGLLVLDRTHKLVWRFDQAFRPVPSQPTGVGELLTFQPKQGPTHRQKLVTPAEPMDLAALASSLGEMLVDPLALEPLPDGSFWLLEDRGDGLASRVWLFNPASGVAPQVGELLTLNLVEAGADDLNLHEIRGHDLAYLPQPDEQGRYLQQGTLFIADVAGNQAYALRVDLREGLILRIDPKYYPLRSFTGAALVAVWIEGQVYYHQGQRWLPVKALPQQRYETEAILLLPAFDGRDPGCVWHRLCLEACLPPDTGLRVETRAADVAAELGWQSWQAQPNLYQRAAGSELPYTSLWTEAEQTRPDTGTWELLFQETRGRYMQLRLTLSGNGRSTPLLRALRAHYPRFSYLKQYLPAVYQQDQSSGQFLENFLANPEGLFTTMEGMIAQAQLWLDPRTTPPEAVDWLAGWLGLALEPGWSDYQRRLLIAQAAYFFQRRGTLLGLMQAILLTVYPEIGPRIFQDDIDQFCSTVRIVEHFLTRTRPGVAAGDPSELESTLTGDVLADAEARAHRFTVMLPTTLDEPTRRRVERIIELEKPAHTSFAIKQYWAMFRVGEVRLGLDTVLGQGSRFETFRLGQTALAEGVLGAGWPPSGLRPTLHAPRIWNVGGGM